MSDTQKQTGACLVFGIGPVQDFIATARRTQDLWMGSYILSYLTAKAMSAIVADCNKPVEILYPTLQDQPLFEAVCQNKKTTDRRLTLATLPNKFTVQVASLADGEHLAKKAVCDVHAAWSQLTKDVAANFPEGLKPASGDWKALWKEQTKPEHWIEIYWAVYPTDTSDEVELIRRAERAFEARKSLRNFASAEELGEKCTVCGIRAALGSERAQQRSKLREEWKYLSKILHEEGEKKNSPYSGLAAAVIAEGKERLCAICTCKRFAQRFFFEDELNLEGGFPSTSSIASVMFRKEVMRLEFATLVTQFIEALEKAGIPRTLATKAFPKLSIPERQRYDGDLFYLETYTAKRLNEDYGMSFSGDNDPNLVEARRSIKILRDTANKANPKILPPPKYYAVLLMDGDHMGQHLSRAKSVNEYQEISNKLRDFALNEVQRIVEDDCFGRVVYAGGDDLMAFLPLEFVLVAARELRDAFVKIFGENSGFTTSAGIAIAHHLAPLDGVFKAARDAEEIAKNKYQRDAVVVTALKRSGEHLEVGARWQYGDLKTLKLIQSFRDFFRAESLSPRFAFEAEIEADALSNLGEEAHKKSLERLLKRHGDNSISQIAEQIAGQLAKIGAGLRSHLLPSKPATVEIARWLLLARFLAAASAGDE